MPDKSNEKHHIANLSLYTIFLISGIFIIWVAFFLIVPRIIDLHIQNNSTINKPPQKDEQNSVYDAFYPLNTQAVLNFIEQGRTGFIYAGRPTCPYCQAFSPVLAEVVRQEGTTVYYYDVDAASKDGESRSEALSALGVTGVPTFVYVENGITSAKFNGAHEASAILDFIHQF